MIKDESVLFDLNKDLSLLLGWKVHTQNVPLFNDAIVEYKHSHIRGLAPWMPDGPIFDFPDWIDSKANSFDLMVQHKADVSFYDEGVSVYVDGNAQGVSCFYQDWGGVDRAVSVALVKAVIDKLTREQNEHADLARQPETGAAV